MIHGWSPWHWCPLPSLANHYFIYCSWVPVLGTQLHTSQSTRPSGWYEKPTILKQGLVNVPGWKWTHSVAQTGLELMSPWHLGSQGWSLPVDAFCLLWGSTDTGWTGVVCQLWAGSHRRSKLSISLPTLCSPSTWSCRRKVRPCRESHWGMISLRPNMTPEHHGHLDIMVGLSE